MDQKDFTEKEIKQLLESNPENAESYTVPDHLDKEIKSYIHSKKENSMGKSFPGSIKFLLAAAALIIVAVPLYFIFGTGSSENNIAESGEYGDVVVTFYYGTAEYFENEQWQLLDVGFEIKENSKIRTGPDSELEVTYPDNSIIRLKENTEILFSELKLAENDNHTDIEMISGVLLAKITKLSGESSFELESQCAVLGVRGTEFLVEADSGFSNIIVKEGSVAVRKNTVLPDSVSQISDKLPEAGKIIQELQEQEVLVNENSRIEIKSEELKTTQDNINSAADDIIKIINEKEQAGAELDADEIEKIKLGLEQLKKTETDLLNQDVLEIPESEWEENYKNRYEVLRSGVKAQQDKNTGRLIINTGEGECVVYIDSIAVYSGGPAIIKLSVNAGESIKINAEKPGYETFTGIVQLSPDEVLEIDIEWISTAPDTDDSEETETAFPEEQKDAESSEIEEPQETDDTGDAYIFYTDFNEKDSRLIFDKYDPNDVLKIEDSILHMKNKMLAPGQTSDTPMFRFMENLPENHSFSFRVKFNEIYNYAHPYIHIYLRFMDWDNFYCLMFSNDWIRAYSKNEGNITENDIYYAAIVADKWYDMKIEVKGYMMYIYIDDYQVTSTFLGYGIGKEGRLFIETHNEMWLDSFSISEIEPD